MIEIYSANDSEWNNYLSLFDLINNQLHFTSEYHKLFSNHRNEPILFIFKQNSDCFFYPFMKRRINEDYYDITSVFGYIGPLIINQDIDFLADADKALKKFLYNENVISELIRFNPICDIHEIYLKSSLLNLVDIKDYVQGFPIKNKTRQRMLQFWLKLD